MVVIPLQKHAVPYSVSPRIGVDVVMSAHTFLCADKAAPWLRENSGKYTFMRDVPVTLFFASDPISHLLSI